MIDINNFNNIKDKIYYSLINIKRNKNDLQNIPYKEFYDMGVIYRIYIDDTHSIKISNEILNVWNKTIEEIEEIANENTPKLFEPKCMQYDNIFLLSTRQIMNGASVMLYDNVLNNLSTQIETELLLLYPISTERVCVSRYFDNEILVRKIIKEQVEDVLSENVFVYNKRTNNITLKG